MANNYNINNNTSGMGGNIIADPVAAAIHARARSPSLRKLRRRRRGFLWSSIKARRSMIA